MISYYNAASTDEMYGIKNMRLVVSKRLKIQGFIVSDPDMGPAYAVEHQKNVQKWSMSLANPLILNQRSCSMCARFKNKGFLASGVVLPQNC